MLSVTLFDWPRPCGQHYKIFGWSTLHQPLTKTVFKLKNVYGSINTLINAFG